MLSGYMPRRGKKVFVSLTCTSEDEVPWRLLIFRERRREDCVLQRVCLDPRQTATEEFR